MSKTTTSAPETSVSETSTPEMSGGMSRRAVLAGAGALVVSFSMIPAAFAQSETPEGGKLPGSLSVEPNLDAWIKITPDNAVTVFTGKAELGQGIKTAF